jgi:hypothetical protein
MQENSCFPEHNAVRTRMRLLHSSRLTLWLDSLHGPGLPTKPNSEIRQIPVFRDPSLARFVRLNQDCGNPG